MTKATQAQRPTTDVPAEQEQSGSAATPARTVVPLADVINAVRADSQDEPRAFIDETTVPHGGE